MDYYDLLGVNPKATKSEIKTSYRKLAQKHHPDKSGGDDRKFKQITEAYGVLTDDKKRRIYDLQGQNGVRSYEQKKSSQKHMNAQAYKVSNQNRDFNDIFTAMFNNINIDSTSGADSEKPQKQIPKMPEFIPTFTPDSTNPVKKEYVPKLNINQKLKVSLVEIYRGAKKPFTYVRNLICPKCYGRGNDLRQGKPCSKCHGKQTIEQQNTIEIAVKPGMTTAVKFKFENLGHEYPNMSTGCLTVKLDLDNQTPFEISGSNLKLKLKITLLEALTGVQRDITFVDGSPVRLETPKNEIIQSGEIKIYRGCGLPVYQKPGLYGDLLVEYIIYVKLPTHIGIKTKQRLIEVAKELAI
jgi:DnaJ-class molecular chaperone